MPHYDSVILIRPNNPYKPTTRGVSPKVHKAPFPCQVAVQIANKAVMNLTGVGYAWNLCQCSKPCEFGVNDHFRSQNAQKVSAPFHASLLLLPGAYIYNCVCVCVNLHIYIHTQEYSVNVPSTPLPFDTWYGPGLFNS